MESVATIVASITIPIGYVGFIHMFDYNGVDRDHPISLKKRFCAAVLHNALSLGVSYALLRHLESPFHAMGFHLHGTVAAVAGSSLLTGIFYLGNCLEKVHDELNFPLGIGLFSLRSWMSSARELTFIRNTFIAPVTEEIAFRACSATLFYNCFGWNGAVFVAPLFFSLSHLHHVFDDMRKGYSKKEAILLRTFQATYSYLFGVYATFLLLRTNHILVPIVSHSICNNLGLPNYSFNSSSRKWTRSVFAGHIIGAVGWNMSVELSVAKRSLAWIVKDFDYKTKDISKGYNLKRLRDVVRKNEAIIEEFVDSLFEYLRRDDCDVRLAALLVADYFFQRSHAFRTQIVESLQDFLLCTAETDPLRYPLPEPLTAAKRLKTESLKIVKSWYDKFSPAYGKLRIANDFLKASKSFDYERVDAALRIEQQQAEEERQRREALSTCVTEKLQSVFAENQSEINKCLRETKNAIELLYPRFLNVNEESSNGETARDTRNPHGFYAGDEIKIVIKQTDTLVKEDESNKDLFESLRDSYKMLSFHLKAVTRWLQKLNKHMMDSNRDLMKTLIDLKNEIQVNIDKCKDLKADVPKKTRRAVKEGESESEEDDDDEFVDVEEKEGIEYDFKHDDDIPQHVLDRIARMEENDPEPDPDKPGPSGVTIVSDQEDKPCCSKDIRPSVPTLSYGLDLKYWVDKDAKPAELPKNVFDGMNFWKPAEADVLNEAAESYQVRVMTFVGDESGSSGPQLTCRARMKNEKLCPRKDRNTCPFHGKIIPRDELGFPLEENGDVEALEREKEREKKEEEEMVRDIELVTGVSLTGGNNNHKPTRSKHEKSESTQTRDRLTKKLFDKKSLKRVTETLEAMRQAKVQKLHGHNFTHSLQRK